MNAETLGIIDESDAPEFERADSPEQPVSSQAEPEKTSADPVEAPAAEPAAASEVPAASSAFRFLNRDWESQAKAEEILGSQEGRIAKLNETNQDYAKRLNDYWEYIQAVSKENESFRAQFEKPVEAKEEKKAAGESDEEWMKSVQMAMDIARSRGMDPMQVMAHAMNERFEKRLTATLDERIAKATEPLQRMEETSAKTVAEQNLFLWAQSQGGENPKYPELRRNGVDTAFVTDLYAVFGELAALHPQFAHSGAGFDYAYRLTREYRQGSASAAPASDAPVGRDEKGRFTSMNGAARAASDINGTSPKLDAPAKDEVQERLKDLGRHQPISRGGTSLGFFE